MDINIINTSIRYIAFWISPCKCIYERRVDSQCEIKENTCLVCSLLINVKKRIRGGDDEI